MKPYLLCPTCGSDDIMKNGTTCRSISSQHPLLLKPVEQEDLTIALG